MRAMKGLFLEFSKTKFLEGHVEGDLTLIGFVFFLSLSYI